MTSAKNIFPLQHIHKHVIAVQGLREGHEPYRFLATQAAIQMLSQQSEHILAAAALLISPIKLALNTLEPSLVGNMLLMLQRYG